MNVYLAVKCYCVIYVYASVSMLTLARKDSNGLYEPPVFASTLFIH